MLHLMLSLLLTQLSDLKHMARAGKALDSHLYAVRNVSTVLCTCKAFSTIQHDQADLANIITGGQTSERGCLCVSSKVGWSLVFGIALL